MIQSHKTWTLSRRRKRRRCIEGFYRSSTLYSTLLIITCLNFVPQGTTQHSDDIYTVKPTPALRLGKEELTTVLLVNTENHGRFINVRPEVGLLTSTARTFIQEGVTTEYATQVVGTTLDNGRVYAQYLKKSSRVLYDKSGVPLPSVVTSWVGESLHSDATFLPQSHNDLLNAEQPDWQAIDDRLLGNRHHSHYQDDFIGNTDFIGYLRTKTNYETSSNQNEEAKVLPGTVIISSLSSLYLSNAKPVFNSVPQLGFLDENARKVAASKILPIGDLPTYTIKLNYKPNAYSKQNDRGGNDKQIGDNESVETFDRSPKLIYKKLIQNGEQKIYSALSPLKSLVPVSRHLATVTYYGFAEFTTIVGDSVIVFLPSTSTPYLNLKAYITSIKGEATLGAEGGLQQGPNIPKAPITVAQDFIEPTLTEKLPVETSLTMATTTHLSKKIETETTTQETTSQSAEMESTEKEILKIILESSEVMVQPSQSKISSINSMLATTSSSVMLSRPSDEEILRIYNSLANANLKIKEDNIATTLLESGSISSSSSKNVIEASNVQIFGGATTIFFEDDPFANFVDATKSKKNLGTSKPELGDINFVTTTEENIANQELLLGKEEFTTESSITKSESAMADLSLSTSTTPTNINLITTQKKLHEEEKSISDLLSKVLIKEIDPNTDEIPNDCISTSQVFLTQLPKTVSNYETVTVTNDLFETVTKTRLQIQPTFEIKEATKYYCIQGTAIQANQIESPSITSSVVSENKNEKNNVLDLTTTSKTIVTEKRVGEITQKADDDKNEENLTEKNSAEITTQSPNTSDENHDNKENEKYVEEKANEEGEASGEQDEDDVNGDDEEIELIYKTLYTTYTYLTTFFRDDSTSVSSHTEVVTNIMTSTLGITVSPSLKSSSNTQLAANLDKNHLNPISTMSSTSIKYEMTSKRYMVPSEVESIIRTDEHLHQESEKSIEGYETIQSVIEISETLATFYTTYTYYTTIFAEGDTDIMSHTEIITNIEKAKATANIDATKVMGTTTTFSLLDNFENSEHVTESNNIKTNVSETNASLNNMVLPNIPDLGELPAITLVTDVRSSSSSGNQQIINQYEKKTNINESNQQQHFSVLEDQVSSESNTDTDEIMPLATLLLQTSFTTFTYYTTMYSGDKTNVISRLETMTNTVTETLPPSKTTAFDTSVATIPVTYFTTFTYWTKLARDGQIATLSREETISNVITPTLVQQSEASFTAKIGNMVSTSTTGISQKLEEHIIATSNEAMTDEITEVAMRHSSQNMQYITKVLEPTTYYTTYTYYTTSYESDKTITDSRFETVTDILTPTVTLTNNIEYISTFPGSILSPSAPFPTPLSGSIITTPLQSNTGKIETELILYDFKKIIDADGISTIFYTTEIKPTKNAEGHISEVIISTSSLLINEEKRKTQATETPLTFKDQDGQIQKLYKTGLVRLIEGTRIGNRTTTLYQSKVIGTVINQRYAQIIESTSSFIFEKIKTQGPEEVQNSINLNLNIIPTSLQNIYATQSVGLNSAGEIKVEGSIDDKEDEKEEEVDIGKSNGEPETEDESQTKGNDERLRYPFQTKKPSLITPSLKTFSNRNRPQFAPKKNSNATIITRSDFTPTITATPALKTINRFSTSRRGSSSNAQVIVTSPRRFGRPTKSSAQGLQSRSSLSPLSRNRFTSSSSIIIRGSSASSTRRLTGPSLSRSSLFSSAFPAGNSRLRIRPTASASNLSETSSTLVNLNSPQEKENSLTIDEPINDDKSNDNEEEYTTESSRRQNNPLLRLRRPLNRPQGFTPIRAQPNSPSNTVSLSRNPLVSRSRNNAVTTSTTTTTTARPKPRTFQTPVISQNRRTRPTSSLFPPRNIFLGQKPTSTVDQNKDLSEETDDDEEDLNDNNDDSEYEDEDDEEETEDENNNRRRRSHVSIKDSRKKREANPAEQNLSNFRNRFRRPKLAPLTQAESKSSDDDKTDSLEILVTTASTPTNQKTRSRLGPRYTGHSPPSATTATTLPATSTKLSKQKAIRPTRPTNSNGGRPQFTLRDKDSSSSTSTQKGLTSVKRPAFRRPQPGGSTSSRRLPSSTSTSSTSKRRQKAYTNSDTTTTARNSVTTRNRSPSLSSSTSRSRSTGSSRDNTVRGRPRNNFNNNNNNNNINNNDDFGIDNSGTIIVTHVIPTDVTIPVINGKLTEYKQVVTAKTSTEVLGPQQYTMTLGANGFTQLVLTREDSSVNYNGATEVTQYVLHETPTTTITFTPTTIRGRKTSFSHILPSTVYSVEQIVSTVQPQISSNAPLANILLSQLLLGNIGLPAANPLLGALGGLGTQPGLGTAIGGQQQMASPITEYKTHVSTYVTTVFEGQSTVLPVTFQGKKILTTIFDTTAQTITATEFITDTIVTTPTVKAQAPAVNSLLLQQFLLQQHLQQQLHQKASDPINPLNAILNSVPPQLLLGGDNLQELEVSNSIRGSGHVQADLLNEDDDFTAGSSIELDDTALQAQPQAHKNGRKKSRKNGKNHKRKQNNNLDNNPLESSVVTLYVSGRRPGEFSTVLSTVQVRPDSTQYKRQAHTIDSIKDYFNDGSELINTYLAPPPEIVSLEGKATEENLVQYYTKSLAQMPTQSLESIVGDVGQWYVTQTITLNTSRYSHSTTERQKSSSTVIEIKTFKISNLMNSQSQNFFA